MIKFRVDGEPQPWPKKNISVRGGKPVVYTRDKGGLKAQWSMMVAIAGGTAALCGKLFVSKPQAIKILIVVYRTPPKRNKLPYPSSRPDLDNLCYLPHNVLEGVCYEDDSQICHLNEWKLWATEEHPPGLEIEISRILETGLNEYGRS